MKLINKLVFAASLIAGISLVGCDKTKVYDTTVAPPLAHFLKTSTIQYAVRGAGPIDPITIGVGTSDVTNSDRTVTISVTSPTGAAAGTQYNLSSNTVTIAAGTATADFTLQGLLTGYPAGRLDTLFLTITEPSLKPAAFLSKVTVVMGDICSESDAFNLNDFLGDYANTNETLGTSAYGPYTTTITAVASLTPTTGKISVANIFDDGWQDAIDFTLDWTDPNNKVATCIQNSAIAGSDAGTLNSAYSGMLMAIRQANGYPGTFSSCDQTFTLKTQLGVSGLGWFGIPANLYTINLAR